LCERIECLILLFLSPRSFRSAADEREIQQVYRRESPLTVRTGLPKEQSPHLAILRDVDRNTPSARASSQLDTTIDSEKKAWTPRRQPFRPIAPPRQTFGQSEILDGKSPFMTRNKACTPSSLETDVRFPLQPVSARADCTNPMGLTLWYHEPAENRDKFPESPSPMVSGLSSASQMVRPTATRPQYSWGLR
jgi:hypothetical protein